MCAGAHAKIFNLTIKILTIFSNYSTDVILAVVCLNLPWILKNCQHGKQIQNVSSKGQDIRMRDPSRAVQTPESINLQLYADLFKQAESGKFIILLICLIF